ncbi:hsp90 co-chaperone Cdc37-like protein [Leptotrombidium deliense]|uniref:Hsp90 co-chaperone Cdc37 n=1 Tax=Leptotrombidium deliense TaxID=299467 RepID=A0A443SJ38_9ACAR|nr:hsp90 co-chaperone Cdc37-like protein [Leptotrombidium deliense]
MVDYSKWKNIEVSDDEDETHPNIDTPSLFKWRHEARVNRMAEMEEERKAFYAQKQQHDIKRKELKEKLKAASDDDSLKKALSELEIEEKKLKAKEDELKKKERLTPWNVDTISKPGWSKTVINKPAPRKDDSHLTEEQREENYRNFVKENESKVKHYGMLSKWDDCKQYLLENPHLCCDDTANYLALWCLNLEIEEKHQLMEHVAKQVISMQYILELAKQLDRDPRSCISSFFTRIQAAEKEYITAFEDEYSSFKKRIVERAKVRIEEAMKEVEEEEKQKRLGPGGLDPAEVFETLPPSMQECFEKKDIAMLQKVIAEMDEKDARYHMKRCVDSGLWVPDSKTVSEGFSQDESAEVQPKEV